MGMPCLKRSRVKNIGMLIIWPSDDRGFFNLEKKTNIKRRMNLIYFIIITRAHKGPECHSK
jgi:hypothetical protein